MNDEIEKKLYAAIAPIVGDVLREGRGLELFVSLGVNLASEEGASDAVILKRVREEALFSLSERNKKDDL